MMNPNYAIAQEKYQKKKSTEQTNELVSNMYKTTTGAEITDKDFYYIDGEKFTTNEYDDVPRYDISSPDENTPAIENTKKKYKRWVLKGDYWHRLTGPAIIREDNNDYVFVKEDDDIYRMMAVKLGPEGKGYRPVISGLKEGQKIAVNGAFHLNSERKRQLSGG
jgi:hypothetical protein